MGINITEELQESDLDVAEFLSLDVLNRMFDNFNSVWHVQKLADHDNLSLHKLRTWLIDHEEPVNLSPTENSNIFCKFGVLLYKCNCPTYMQYAACKHALFFTLKVCGWTNVPTNMRRAPIRGRRAPRPQRGRPGRLAGALTLPSQALTF